VSLAIPAFADIHDKAFAAVHEAAVAPHPPSPRLPLEEFCTTRISLDPDLRRTFCSYVLSNTILFEARLANEFSLR
jgi:hypothetical protein